MLTKNSHMNPVYGKEEIDSVYDYVNSSGWIMEHTKTKELESLICNYTGAKYAHMVTSATTGLLCASMVAKIKPGEKFAVSAYTQAATCNGAILMGGVPVIVDVDPFNYCINFDKIPADCRVIFVSAINGRYPKDVQEQIKSLRENGRVVIEDSAQALGSKTINDIHCGTMGDMGVFSFGAPKIITTGQGGCIVTNDENISKQIHAIKNFGRTVKVGEVYNVMGLNFKFTDLQASFGVPQMKKLPFIVQHKKQLFKWYRTHLKGVVDFIPTDLEYATPTYPEILVSKRDKLVEELRVEGIGCRAVYDSLCNQPFHRKWRTLTPIADELATRGLHLPGQFDLREEDVKKIASVVKNHAA